ncbi:hypothetical protein [Microtetraspora malaysiensis]|uniref:hypothetical protein n=1 Tax=Microtetraspora malaysiensis TaxID=161358 RepID=UPI00082CEDD8|nr:hypothetical protein [Microtetraspora malaysiensis]
MGYPGDQQPHRQPYLPQGEPPAAARRPEARPYGSAPAQPGALGHPGPGAPAFDPWRRPQQVGDDPGGNQSGNQGGRSGSRQAGTWAEAASRPGGPAGAGWGPEDASGGRPGTAPWNAAGLSGDATGGHGQPGAGTPPGTQQQGGFPLGSPTGGFPSGAQPGDHAPGGPGPSGTESGGARPSGTESGAPLATDPRGGRASGPSEPSRAEQRAAESSEPPWDPYGPVPFWRRPLVLVLAGLALIGALFAGLWVAASREEPPRAAPKPSPTPPPISPAPGGKYGYAGSRTTDKTPLTATELFGQKKVTAGSRSYLRTKVNKEKKCADGVSGEKITKALKDGGCTQLIRASYKDTKGKIIGSIGVANVKTTTAAKKVASAGGGKERQDFLKPLPGTDDISKFLGTGDAYAGGWIHGHYTILLWFQFKDGHNPSKTELKRLYQAALDITEKTVFPALDTRSLTGGHG